MVVYIIIKIESFFRRKTATFKNMLIFLSSMAKKCIICGESASFAIRGTSDFYCDDCATENFADTDVLEKVEAPQ